MNVKHERIDQEKKTVLQMVEIYCHGKNHERKRLLSFACPEPCRRVEVCEECSALLDYAYLRLDHCKFGEKKPTCKKVAIKREQRKTRLPLPSVSKLDHRSSAQSIAISRT